LGERVNGIHEVTGSIPVGSTIENVNKSRHLLKKRRLNIAA
jgi:hypothetical protein